MEQYIAIDLGAVYTKVAFRNNSDGNINPLQLSDNDNSIPTAVCIIDEKDADSFQDVEYKGYWWAVGEKAVNQKKLNHLCYAERFKSNLNRADIFDEKLDITYIDLVTVIFKYIQSLLKANANFAGNRHFALTVPVGTTSYSKRWEAMKEAAINAELVSRENVDTNLTMIHESVAAGYCFDHEFEELGLNQGHKKFAIFDFGGSTLDCAYFAIDDGYVSLYSQFPDICTSSLASGGLYMNEVIIKDIIDECQLGESVKSSKQLATLSIEEQRRLYQLVDNVTRTAEIIKRNYLEEQNRTYEIEYGKTYYETEKEHIEELLSPIVTKASECLKSLVRDNPLDVIIPVGGSSLLPLVEETLRKDFQNVEILRPAKAGECVEENKYFYAVCIGAVRYLLKTDAQNKNKTKEIADNLIKNKIETNRADAILQELERLESQRSKAIGSWLDKFRLNQLCYFVASDLF